jgi:hypothetical protein
MLALELLWFKDISKTQSLRVGPVMWMEKLSGGVLRVLTPFGPRYILPTFRQRIYLLWIFRNFQTLPLQVLRPWQQRLIDGLCAEQRFASLALVDGWEDAPIIGTLERRPPVEVETLPARRASRGVRDAVARS